MRESAVHDEPSDVDAENGVVRVRGPAEIDIRMTPEAAEETSHRLLTGVLKARGQLYFKDPRED